MHQPDSDSDSLLSTGPPPSYNTYDNQRAYGPRYSPASEGGHGKTEALTYTSLGTLYRVLLAALIAGVFILQLAMFFSPRGVEEALDPIQKDRMRSEWRFEREAYQEEHQRRLALRERWEREDRKRLLQKQQWETDRQHHEEEMKRWIEDRARQLGMLWNEPRADGHCIAYGTREYTAQLDELSVCKKAPIMIHNHAYTAQTCEVQAAGYGHARPQVVGRFSVDSDEPDCRPYWGAMYDKGCISRGQGSGIRRVETRLWNLHGGDDWQHICDTTPAVINEIEFSQPTRCEDRGWIWGMVGMFEYPDPSCGWNALADDLDVEEP